MKKDAFLKIMKSMRFRLVMIIFMIGFLPCLLMRAGMIYTYEKDAVSQRSSDVSNQAKILVEQIANSTYIKNQKNSDITIQIQQMANIYNGRVLLVNPAYQIVTDTYQNDTGKIIVSEEVIHAFGGTEASNHDKESNYLELAIPIKKAESNTIKGVMLISVSLDSVAINRDNIATNASVLCLIMAMTVLGIALILSERITKPLQDMSESIKSIEEGFGDYEMHINYYTETEEMSNSFNQLWTKMKLLDESRQEFVSNVSHELKTPLTSMKVLADSINSMGDAPIELYKEFMGDITNEIERENKIITDLLSLVKMDKSAADLNIESVNINELLELILKRLKPIAEKKNVELVLETFRPVTAEVDEVKLTLAISNLVENGIKYNKDNGWVHVTLNADHQFFYVKVEDSGMGIPEDSIEHIFERFYRVDKSHSREIGGTGLGLAITRNAILMHKGAVKAFSTEGEGTTFTVRIPLTYIA